MTLDRRTLAAGGLLVVGAVIPLLFGEYQLFLVTQVLVFAMGALALDIAWGYGGILNLGHAIFFGGGAYLYAFLSLETSLGPGVGIVTAVIGPLVVAVVLGYLLFLSNLGEAYFGILMLGVAATVEQLIGVTEALGGHNGITGVPAFGLDTILYYYLVLAVTAAVSIGVWRLMKRPFGFRLRAVRMNEERTRMLGYHTVRYKLAAFGLSAGLAGLAGALYAGSTGFISPSAVGLVLSVEFLIWLIIGGVGTLIGAFVGTFFLKYIQFYVADIVSELWFLFLGILFVVVVLFLPEGLYPSVRDRWRGDVE